MGLSDSFQILQVHAAAMFNLPTGYAMYWISSQLRALPLPTGRAFEGQHVVITGANSGLGLEAARHVARLGAARVVLACRNAEKGEAARRDLLASLEQPQQGAPPHLSSPSTSSSCSPPSSRNDKQDGHDNGNGNGGRVNGGKTSNTGATGGGSQGNDTTGGGGGGAGNASACRIEVWSLDLTSFESVRQFCGRAERELGGRLDVLIENAGLATGQFEEAEGFEKTITTNVLSTFLLALMLLPLMRRTAATYNTTPHLSIVSSDGHRFAGFRERSSPPIFDHYRSSQRMHDRYNTSKLLEVLVAQELASRVSADGSTGSSSNTPVVVNVLNPGLCRTQLFRNLPFPVSLVVRLGFLLLGRPAEAGARTLVAAALAGPASHGIYMDSCAAWEPSAFVRSDEGARAQKEVWAELAAILDRAEPGVVERAGLGKV